MEVLRNKPPKWSEKLSAYCLNFNGRVTHASVKNFQLISADDPETVLMQFGKVGDAKIFALHTLHSTSHAGHVHVRDVIQGSTRVTSLKSAQFHVHVVYQFPVKMQA